MKPFLILVAMPLLVGFIAEALFRDARRATLAAVIGALAVTFLSVQLLEPAAAWNWIAALLVSPLPIAIAVAAAMYWYGRFGLPPRA